MLGIEEKASAIARKAAIGSASAILAIVGVAFLTVAAWLVLDAEKGAIFAATTIGLVYLGLGLIGFAVAAKGKPKEAPAPPQVAPHEGLSPMQMVAVSFLQGVEKGAAARRKS